MRFVQNMDRAVMAVFFDGWQRMVSSSRSMKRMHGQVAEMVTKESSWRHAVATSLVNACFQQWVQVTETSKRIQKARVRFVQTMDHAVMAVFFDGWQRMVSSSKSKERVHHQIAEMVTKRGIAKSLLQESIVLGSPLQVPSSC